MQFLRKVFEDEDDDEKARSERSDQELALAKAVDAKAMGLESGGVGSAAEALKPESHVSDDDDDPALAASTRTKDYRKMAVLYMLLSACVADVNMAEEGMGSPRVTKGFDTRHRVALRLLATWLDVTWNKMVRRPLHHASSIDSYEITYAIYVVALHPVEYRVRLCDWISWHCRKLSR